MRWLIISILFLLTSSPVHSSGTIYSFGSNNCNDSGSGSRAEPFCSFDVALAHLTPGDTLTILEGSYDNSRAVIEHLHGTPNSPITIIGENATLNGGCSEFPCDFDSVSWWNSDEEGGLLTIIDSSNIIVRDLMITGSIGTGVSVFEGEKIVLDNLTVEGTGNAGILAKYLQGLIISNNKLTTIQQGFIFEGELMAGAHEGISVVGVDDFEVVNNLLQNVLKEGIDVKEGSSDGDVHGNTAQYTCSVGIYINEAFNVRVFENSLFQIGYLDVEKPCGEHPVFGEAFGEFYGTGILLAVGDLGNLSQGALADIDIHHNVIWQTYGNGIETWDELIDSGKGEGSMENIRMLNNTIYDCGLANIRIQDADNVTILNNIIALAEEETITGNRVQEATISNNIYIRSENWHTLFGNGAIDASTEAVFVDAPGGDFQLVLDSLAVDGGIDVGFPFSGSAPDIGAIESATQ